MENYWYLGRWARIPVSMHWTVLLALPWLWLMMGDWLAALIASAAYFVLLVAHESGHALMARWRGLAVQGITLSGLHGETSHDYPRTPRDDVLIAWSGVGAQFLILLLALAAEYALPDVASREVEVFAAPVLMVFTRWNLFLMIVALLPIGPMDGHRAWRIIPMIRQSLGRGRSSGKVVKLDAGKRRQLQQKSEKAAADIIQKLGKKK